MKRIAGCSRSSISLRESPNSLPAVICRESESDGQSFESGGFSDGQALVQSHLKLKEGDDVTFSIDIERAHIFDIDTGMALR
jgi:hypothetical protein